MIRELDKTQFSKVEGLFESLRYQLFPIAVLNKLQDGRIIVDNFDHPKSAFMITRDFWVYLAGDSSNSPFNRELNKAIFNKSLTDNEAWGFLIGCHPDWRSSLGEVLHPREPVEMERRHYIGRKFTADHQYPIPQGYTIHRIDCSLTKCGMDFPQDVMGLINSWNLIQDDSKRGFGFIALQNNEIVAHAVIDVVVGTKGDIGLETSPEHRFRGLATAVAAATIEFGLRERGLTEILWDCASTNNGSIKIAEKLGFEFNAIHQMYIFDFDLMWNQFSLGMSNLDKGMYSVALAHFDKAIETGMENIPPTTYFLKSCALAGLGDKKATFKWLNVATSKGWNELDEIQQRKEFKPWYDTPEWSQVIKVLKHGK